MSSIPAPFAAGRETAPLIRGAVADGDLTDQLLAPVVHLPRWWWPGFAVSGAGTVAFVAALVYSVVRGTGVWGNDIPNAWAFPIINFVWWIGIGHAGTFLSAILLVLGQQWRSSLNRIAEAMALAALVLAGIFPILHLGRPWFFYWLVPYPSNLAVWPQFRSSLPWDVAAITTDLVLAATFFYIGLLPDLATARDAGIGRVRRYVYGVLALGWRGSREQWRQQRRAYLLLAGMAAAMVVVVHAIVSLDFAITQLPGWHSTILPAYFLVGAIHSGVAMLLVILLPVRRLHRLQDVVTERHLESLAKLLLAGAWLLAYCYVIETFMGWYSGSIYERHALLRFRPGGPYAWVYWLMLALCVAVPQLFWWRRLRRRTGLLFGAGVLVLLGMWLERFVTVVTFETQDFLPSSWAEYGPTWVDWTLLLGSVALFAWLYLLFLRFIPPVPIAETRRLALLHARGEAP